MYSREHFQVRVDPRVEGLWVVVLHSPTGWSRTEGPVEPGTVTAVTERLVAALQRELVAPEVLRIETGLSLEGQFVRVVHLPTGRARSAPTGRRPHEVQQQLLDELIKELWEDGLLRPGAKPRSE